METTRGFCRHCVPLLGVVAGSRPCALRVGTVPSPNGHPHWVPGCMALGMAKGTCRFCWRAQGQGCVPEKLKILSSAMREVRGTLPPNRHVTESCCWAASVSFVVLGPATGHTAQTPKSPGPLVKGLEEKSPLPFLSTASSPRTPRQDGAHPHTTAGTAPVLGAQSPKLHSPNLIPTRLLKTQHPPGTGWELTDPTGANSLLLDHAAIPQPHPGGSPRTHPHGHSPAQGLQTLAA